MRGFFVRLPAMPDTQFAVQLYTLRDHCKTESDFAGTCRKLKAQGWGAVQVSAVGVDDPKMIRRILDDSGLVCCVTHHRPGEQIWEEPAAVAETLDILGCDHTAIGGYFPKGEDFNEASWRAWIERFNGAADALRQRGKFLGYHNHSHEFAKLGGKDDFRSETAMELLARECGESVWFEIDTYWVAHGGGDPAAWLRRLGGRVPIIHVKDLAIDLDKQQYMAEVGVGNLDWPGILAAAKEAGVRWYAVEQDVTYRDPFDSLQTSLDNLRAMGLS